MSRNKVILLILCLIIIVLALPETGTAGIIRHNMIALAPYIMILLIIYLFITINMVRKALYRLNDNITTENTITLAKRMGITFDVKRMMGPENLQNIYKRVNFSKQVSMDAKQALYDALKRKRLDIPPPAEGKEPLPEKRSHEEVKKARFGANKKNKKKKKR